MKLNENNTRGRAAGDDRAGGRFDGRLLYQQLPGQGKKAAVVVQDVQLEDIKEEKKNEPPPPPPPPKATTTGGNGQVYSSQDCKG